MANTTGYILWQGPSPYNGDPIVMIATMKSGNRKTGNMAQVWIMPRDVAPHESLKDGSDASVCGPCPLRGDGTGKGRACYVILAQGPLSVWKTFKRGGYVDASSWSDDAVSSLFEGLKVRLGAWGDPAMAPLHRVTAIVAKAAWTGYTHQWPTIDPAWSGILMASADSVRDRAAARAKGYRAFYVAPRDADLSGAAGAVECMATRARNPLQCHACLACSGTRHGAVSGAVDIAIRAHGAGAKYVTDTHTGDYWIGTGEFPCEECGYGHDSQEEAEECAEECGGELGGQVHPMISSDPD